MATSTSLMFLLFVLLLFAVPFFSVIALIVWIVKRFTRSKKDFN